MDCIVVRISPVRLRFSFVAIALALAACQSGPAARSGGPGAAPLAYAGSTNTDPRYAAIVLDAGSGRVLHAENADAIRYPASLAKMMTLYILFSEVESGRLALNSALAVSPGAAAQPPSKLGLKAGSTLSVADAIRALCVKSANDVATVVAENIAGSEAAFADRMTRTARSLGMRSTVFRNASGLPDPAQVTTARDMAVLARALQTAFPEHYRNFSERTFAWKGKSYRNTNQLLGEIPGMDGIKTGYTRASGFNLATSVHRGGRRIIVVVMGESTSAARNAEVSALVAAYMPMRSAWALSQ